MKLKNLLPCVIDVLQNKKNYLKIYGKNYKTKDETCISDYIHLVDLADAHVALLKFKKFQKMPFLPKILNLWRFFDYIPNFVITVGWILPKTIR